MTKKMWDVLEDNDVRVLSVEKWENSYQAELEWYTPLGEDFVFGICYDGTDQDFSEKFKYYAIDFDAEEHAEIWINVRGTNGVPDSIRGLLDDADEIDSFLMKISDKLLDILNAA